MRDKAKLEKLCEIVGADDVLTIIEQMLGDAVSPGICMNEDCDCVFEVEPDQERGYCFECRTLSVKSALVLAEFI